MVHEPSLVLHDCPAVHLARLHAAELRVYLAADLLLQREHHVRADALAGLRPLNAAVGGPEVGFVDEPLAGYHSVYGCAELLLDGAIELGSPVAGIAQIRVGVIGYLGVGAVERLAVRLPNEFAIPRLAVAWLDVRLAPILVALGAGDGAPLGDRELRQEVAAGGSIRRNAHRRVVPLIEIDIAAIGAGLPHRLPDKEAGLEKLRLHVAGVAGAERVDADRAQRRDDSRRAVAVATGDCHGRAVGQSDHLGGTVLTTHKVVVNWQLCNKIFVYRQFFSD